MIPELISPDAFKYHSVSPEYLNECIEKFKINFNNFIETIRLKGYLSDFSMNLRINTPMLYRIVERIDQRKDYYLYFHSNHEHAMIMSQAKETALFCYWLIKYKPITFSLDYEDSQFFLINGYTINEMYAAYLMMTFVIGLKEENLKYFDETTISTLIYSLSNREISKEALILYVESFLTENEKEV